MMVYVDTFINKKVYLQRPKKHYKVNVHCTLQILIFLVAIIMFEHTGKMKLLKMLTVTLRSIITGYTNNYRLKVTIMTVVFVLNYIFNI